MANLSVYSFLWMNFHMFWLHFSLWFQCSIPQVIVEWTFHSSVQFSYSVNSRLFVTQWTTACQASLSITNFWGLPKIMFIESVMTSNHLILCWPLLLLPSIFPNIRVFSNESVLHIIWPQYWSFSFSISPSNEHSGLISLGWTGWISLQSKGLSRVFANTTLQKHQFFLAQLSYSPTLTSIHDYWKNHSLD